MLLLSGQQLVAVLGRRCQGTGLFSVGKLGRKSGEDGWVLLEDEIISVTVLFQRWSVMLPSTPWVIQITLEAEPSPVRLVHV